MTADLTAAAREVSAGTHGACERIERSLALAAQPANRDARLDAALAVKAALRGRGLGDTLPARES